MAYSYLPDPYHIPKNQRHYSHRPDLDAKAEKQAQRRLEEEALHAQTLCEEVKRRRKESRKRLSLSRRRTDQRYDIGVARDAAEVSEAQWKNAHLPYKNQQYYRRTGCLWSDIAHVPQKRLHLVVTPKIVEGDAWAAKEITKRKVLEVEADIVQEEKKQARIAHIRHCFAHQVLRNDRRNNGQLKEDSSAYSPVRESCNLPENSHKAQQEYRRLRKQKEAARFHFNSADFSGLLHNDNYVMSKLSRSAGYQGDGKPFRCEGIHEDFFGGARRPHSAPFTRSSGKDAMPKANTPGLLRRRPMSSTPILKTAKRRGSRPLPIQEEASMFVQTEIDEFEARLQLFHRSPADKFPRARLE